MDEVLVAADVAVACGGADAAVAGAGGPRERVAAEAVGDLGVVDSGVHVDGDLAVDVVSVAELDASACVDALAASRAAVVAAEVSQVRLVAAWADLCNGDSVAPSSNGADGPSGAGGAGGAGGSVLAGMEQVVRPGAVGTPRVREFAAAELGVVLEMTTTGAMGLLRDVLDLRHRHPRLWAGVLGGRVRFWQARQITRAAHHGGLDLAGARYVDERTADRVGLVPWGRMLGLVEAAVIEADPEAAERRRLEKAMERFVRSGQSNEHGLKTLYAQVEAGHAIGFVAMCDRIAQILGACQMVCVRGVADETGVTGFGHAGEEYRSDCSDLRFLPHYDVAVVGRSGG